MSTHFVLLRITQLRGVNVALFNYDYDQTWMSFFLDADGRVYCRYGSRSSVSAENHNSVDGLLDTMDRVLALHNLLADQHGPLPPPPATVRPTDLPGVNALG